MSPAFASARRTAGMLLRRILLLSLLLAVCSPQVRAEPSVRTEERIQQFRETSWAFADGVYVMTQAQDGSLWVGSKTGLFRFDGQRFERVELPEAPELSSSPVSRLFTSKDGGVWVGYTLGGVALVKDGRVRVYSVRDGLVAGTVFAFAEQADGTVWVGTTRGLARLRGEHWEQIDARWNWPGFGVQALMVDSADRLWILSAEGVTALEPGSRQMHEVTTKYWRGRYFMESARGTVWLADFDGLQRLAVNAATGQPRWSAGSDMLLDAEGLLWIRSSTGSLRSVEMPAPNAPDPENVLFDMAARKHRREDVQISLGLLADRDGSFWSITNRNGLTHFSQPGFLSLKSVPGWRPGLPWRVLEMGMAPIGDDKLLFVDSRREDVMIFDGHSIQTRRFNATVDGLTRASDGSVWMGGGHRFWRMSKDRISQVPFHQTFPPAQDFRSIAEEAGGALWVSVSGNGLYRLSDGRWTLNGGVEALPKEVPTIISMDRANCLWAGYLTERAAVLDHGRVHLFDARDGLNVGAILAIYGRRGTVWIGGHTGLVRYDGQRFRPVAVEAADVLRNITGIVETENGDVWVSGAAGVARLPASELALNAADPQHRILSELFDTTDGIEGTSFQLAPLPTLVESYNGKLWASTSQDIYQIDPQHLPRHAIGVIALRSFDVDGKAYEIKGPQELHERANALKFAYQAVSLSAASKIRYRYRVDGVDSDWQPAEERREAYYMNLGPGHYRFRLQARLVGQPWPTNETSLDFDIPPAFVQTQLFMALCATAAAFLIWAIVRWRAYAAARPLRIRLEARLAERERIARDLHDTLLQGMHGFILFVQAAASSLQAGHPTRQKLDRALALGTECVEEGRDRIQDLRLEAELSESLPESLRAVGVELQARSGDTAFETVILGTPCPMHKAVHQEVYRVGREAILNAFQHARASTIELELIYSPDTFRLRVRDDGRGLGEVDASEGVRGHWGLQGMAERTRNLGGEFAAWSKPNAGTEVELQLPAMNAYARVDRTSSTAKPLQRLRQVLGLGRQPRQPA